MDNTRPLVSIFCPTFNHENYIRQCLDSFIMQKTSFPFEILLHDDASTDKTAHIVKEYETNYPNLFKCIYQFENKLSKDSSYLIRTCSQMALGKYVAVCEGDDYWTDPNKLQKQVDFLESEEDYAICFHNTIVYNNEEKKILFEQPGITQNSSFSIQDFFKNNPIATASVVFRRKYIEIIPEWFSQSPFGDYSLYLYILVLSQSKAGYLKDAMAVYRIHKESMHGNVHLANTDFVPAYTQHLKLWELLKKHLFKRTYRKEINKSMASTYNLIIKNLLVKNKYKEAIKYNTLFLFKLHFSYVIENVKLYKHIIRNAFK